MCPWVQPNLRPAILGEPIKVFHMPFVSHFLGGSRPRLVHLEPEGCQLWLHPWWPFCCKQMSQTTKILTGIDLNMTLPEQRWPLPWTLEGECSFCQPAPVCRRLQMQERVKAEPWEAMHHLVNNRGKISGLSYWIICINWIAFLCQSKRPTWEAILNLEHCNCGQCQYVILNFSH